jgi:hypothetical protein
MWSIAQEITASESRTQTGRRGSLDKQARASVRRSAALFKRARLRKTRPVGGGWQYHSREVAVRQFDGKRAKPTSPGLARELHLRLQTDLDGMGAPPQLLLPPLPPLHRRGAWGASGAKEDVVVAILGSGDGLCASAPGAKPFR